MVLSCQQPYPYSNPSTVPYPYSNPTVVPYPYVEIAKHGVWAPLSTNRSGVALPGSYWPQLHDNPPQLVLILSTSNESIISASHTNDIPHQHLPWLCLERGALTFSWVCFSTFSKFGNNYHKVAMSPPQTTSRSSHFRNWKKCLSFELFWGEFRIGHSISTMQSGDCCCWMKCLTWPS